ncbi:MAG: hypothetical protein JSR33_00335 [Proteobacteria bacterium]|nr:hypothetical protein [Pseudomonadota bacterium]
MNIITKLNIRQKVMLILTILAAAFLIWQIYTFIHGSYNSHPVKIVGSTATMATPVPSPAANNAAGPTAATPPPVVQPVPVAAENTVLTTRQQEYLNLVREYQITKIRRQIVEEEAGLASAQKRIADAGKNGNLSGLGSINNGSAWSPNVQSDYQLAYLDRQAGEWTATLSKGDEYTEVHLGSTLADGSKVISIDHQGVVLEPIQGKNITLGFQDSVNLDTNNLSANSSSNNVRSVIEKDINSNLENKPTNAQIAKILGITSAPAPATVPGANSNSANSTSSNAPPSNATPPTPAPAPQTTPNNPAANINVPNPVSAPSSSAPNSNSVIPAPVLKPVSVQELKKHQFQQIAENKDTALDQGKG